MNTSNASAHSGFSYSREFFEHLVDSALAHAKKLGATDAGAEASEGCGLSVSVRKGELENVERNRDKSLGVTVYVGHRRGNASTSDFSQAAIERTVLSLPLALPHWQAPGLWQWAGFGVTGVLGTLGHYCLTRAFHTADISATQSLRFLDLVWASWLGWLVFADVPSTSTWAGALVILLSTVWIARRESRR